MVQEKRAASTLIAQVLFKLTKQFILRHL